MPLQKLRRSLDDREEIEDKKKRSQGRKESCLVRVATRHARIAVKLGITRGVVNNLKELDRKLTEIVVQPAVINKGLKLLGMFLNSNTQSDVNIVGNKSEEEQKFSMHQVDQENVKGKRKEEVIDNQTRQENVKGGKRKLNGHGVYVSTRMLRALLMIIIPGPLKMKNADTGSTVHQASTAAKLNQPAQGSTMHNASQNASCN
ncbi:hypothetical protein NC653_021027 [Populus alba x Populus x berolinensis]|uniref:Uncharacterized protein n=1 Tax=Populus alba x Populus x berolinensis TaxID=444605 RepID=A0AAD6MMJ9_9ROSI|nr:hypothetical protein NC653_021027 [Populus alba x Populus x berolinensis]